MSEQMIQPGRDERPRRVHVESSDDDQKDTRSTTEQVRDRLLGVARERYGDFEKTYGKLINAYYGTPDISFTMKPGGWYIDLEKIEVNADPRFFVEKGYNESESLFATFHEAEHFRDMLEDPEAYDRLFQRIQNMKSVHTAYPKALHGLYNCLDDILVNKRVMKRWKAGNLAKDTLYPKLFPNHILAMGGDPPQKQPKHRQFMYALLREAMMPHEKCVVDPEVEEVIEDLKSRGGAGGMINALTGVDRFGGSRLKATERFNMILIGVEKKFEQFYLEDLKDAQKKPGDEPTGEEGEGDPFGDDPFEDEIPDPIDFEDVKKHVDTLNKKIAEKKAAKFEEAMGVMQEDFVAYRKDYQKIESYIDKLSKVFDAVIQRRKTYIRRLSKPVKEGPVLDPRKIATAVAEIKSGNLEPTVMLDFEKETVLRHVPSRLDFTLVCDGSGSMSHSNKEIMQRQLAVLAVEAFAKFQEKIEKERSRGTPIQLEIRSEVRMFSSKAYTVKPLSSSLTHEDRVKMRKTLKNLPGDDNNEIATFQAIERSSLDFDTRKELKKGKLKKIVIFLTDGESDVSAIQHEIKRHMEISGGSNYVIAGIGFDAGVQAKDTYAPHGYYAKEFDDVPKIFEHIVEDSMEDI